MPGVGSPTLSGGLRLRDGAAEPVIETCRADARVLGGGEALVGQLCAEIEGVDVCDHLTRVSVCGQVSSDEFVETYGLGAREFDRAVQGLFDCEVGQGGGDVVGYDGLHEGRGQPNGLAVGGGLGDGATNSKNCVERRIVYGIFEALIRFSWAIFARKYPLASRRSVPTTDTAIDVARRRPLRRREGFALRSRRTPERPCPRTKASSPRRRRLAAPASASARPSPVRVLTPKDGDAATT